MKTGPFSLFIILITLLSAFLNFNHCSTSSDPPDYHNGKKFGYLKGFVKDFETGLPISGSIVMLLDNNVSDTTDNEGAYSLDSLNIGTDTIQVQAIKYLIKLEVLSVQEDTLYQDILLQYKAGIDCIPAIDTNYVYISPNSGRPMPIYPRALFARFYPSVTDTNVIIQVLEQYNLEKTGYFFGLDNQLVAFLCIKDYSRPECHFTPWGKPGINNFGTNPIVEYCFGIFSWGHISIPGNINFKFIEDTPQMRIDSLFNTKGLRFLYTWNFHGKWHRTLVTPQAPKNVLALSKELFNISFIDTFIVDLGTSPNPILCE